MKNGNKKLNINNKNSKITRIIEKIAGSLMCKLIIDNSKTHSNVLIIV